MSWKAVARELLGMAGDSFRRAFGAVVGGIDYTNATWDEVPVGHRPLLDDRTNGRRGRR